MGLKSGPTTGLSYSTVRLLADGSIVVYAGTQGFLDDVPVARVQEFQNALLAYIDSSAPGVRQALAEKRERLREIIG